MTRTPARAILYNEDGTFADREVLRRAKVLNIISGCLGALWFSLMLGSYLPLFARSLNAGDLAIGMLATVPSLAHIFQIVSAWVVEHLGRRKPFWAVVEFSRRLVMGAVIFLPFVFDVSQYGTAVVVLLMILGLSSVLGAAGFSPWYSWMADMIPEKERGRFWGVRGAIVNTVIIVFVPLFGRVLDVYGEGESFVGFAIVFSTATVIGLADIVIHSFIPEPPMKKSVEKVSLRAMIMQPLKNADFRMFFMGWGLWSFATLITTPFYSVYYRENLNIGYQFLGMLTSISLSASVAGWWFWGVLADKLGSRPVFTICTSASIPTLILFFFVDPGNARTVLSIQALYGGFVAAGMGVGFTNLLMGLSPREGRGMFVAVFFSTTGAISAIAPIVGGLIARSNDAFWFGGYTRYHNLILTSLVLYLFCLPFFFRIRERHSTPIGVVLANIMFTNPVRTFARLNVLNAGRSVRSSVNALRQLAESRSRIATEDLLARLDDPSVIVREEAVNALGRIGDPGAVGALIERLGDPEAYSSLAIIRALGMIGDERAVDTLTALLSDDDYHTRSAAARALGELGSEKAVDALKNLLLTERSAQVIANAIESLGHTGHAADIWEVLPSLGGITNPILKRQAALAVGNLLGGRDEFYRILSTERRNRGRGIKKLLSLLLKNAHPGKGSSDLRRIAGELREAYDGEDMAACASLLLEAGIIVARDVYNYQGPRERLLEVTVLKDSRFAGGMWFLEMLAGGDIEPSGEDVLLGLYFLSMASETHT